MKKALVVSMTGALVASTLFTGSVSAHVQGDTQSTVGVTAHDTDGLDLAVMNSDKLIESLTKRG
ncbi:MAG: hypothetical protein ACXVDJ_08300, partial [Tumebacillaceae bacterium]